MANDPVRPMTAGPAAGTATAQIAPLKELKDYKVAGEDPDVRGWNVLARDGRAIGDVHDLLVDTAAMRVRYLDVELDKDLLASVPPVPGMAHHAGLMEHRHVLVPIGTARLDEDHDRVYVESLDSSDVAVLPAYDHTAFGRDYENGVRQRWDRNYAPTPAGTASAAGGDYYAGDLYDEERFYGPRRKKRGLFGR
ncbi:MAG: PRC-barrel domain-containing protein [Thermoanaerobaculia bacterium]